MFVFLKNSDKLYPLTPPSCILSVFPSHAFYFVNSSKLEVYKDKVLTMERRAVRVSEAQWNILLNFLEQNPNLARARGYNNSAQGRAEAFRLWNEVAELLNAEGAGTTKTPKDWSVYVSNYKSKLKKIVADINADANSTGGGPPRANSLSDTERRFLAIMGQGFGQSAPQVSVHPFPDMDLQQLTTASPETVHFSADSVQQVVVIGTGDRLGTENRSRSPISIVPSTGDTVAPSPVQAGTSAPSPTHATSSVHLPRLTRQRRNRSRPLAPLDEARRILSQVEMQRAAADAASASALNLIGQNIGRLADAVEKYISSLGHT